MEKQFCDLYTEQRQELYLYFYRHTKNDQLAQDLCHDVYLKFWMLKDKYSEIENLRAYLMQMAKNTFYDFSKHQKLNRGYRQTISYNVEMVEGVTQAFIDERELIRKFQQSILLLTKHRRTVFVLAKMEGWPRKKIARTLGVSELTVKATMQSALKDIYDYMGIRKSKKQLKCRRTFSKTTINPAIHKVNKTKY